MPAGGEWSRVVDVMHNVELSDLILSLPPERPRLQLQPRTKPLEDTSAEGEGGGGGGGGGGASSSIFGQAKPVDTAAREKEIEERLLREQERAKERKEVCSKGKERRGGVMSDAHLDWMFSF